MKKVALVTGGTRGIGASISQKLKAAGYINTEMTEGISESILAQITQQIPMDRLGNPNEIANAVLFLASEDAGFITGTTITINGGQYFV